MASEIRVDKINSLSGVGTVTLSPTGVDIAGITTAATLRATTGIVTSLTAGSLTSLDSTESNSATTGAVTIAGGLGVVKNIYTSGAAYVQGSGGLTVTHDVSIADKIIHTGDTDTAIRFAGDDIFTIETGGSERVRVDSAGLKIPDKLLHFGDVDTAIRFPSADTVTVETGGSERVRIEPTGNFKVNNNLSVTGIATVGSAVTISESGIEASGIGITCANINGGQIGGRRNVIINGSMQIWQRSTSATNIGGSNGYFACDRYRSSNNGSQRYTISQSTDTPDEFGYSMKIDVTTANSSPSASNYVFFQHRLEGQDVQQFAKGYSDAKQYTLSFHVKSPKTGVHVVQWEDVQNTRSTSKSYTVSQANTWEKHTITFDADTTGAISNDSSHRMQLYFWLMAGSTYNSGSLATTWGDTGSSNRAAGQVNVFDSTSNDFYITGIQLEVGSQATAFEHRNFAEELALCQRYCMKWWNHGGTTNNHSRFAPGYYATTTQAALFFNHPVPMRATDGRTLTHNIGNMEQMTGGGNSNSLSIMADGSYNTSTTLLLTGLSGVTANTIYIGRVGGGQTNWYIIVSCEL